MGEAGSDRPAAGAPGASSGSSSCESISAGATPRWPARLQEVSRELRRGRHGVSRDKALEEAWLLLESALSRYARYHSSHLGEVSREDVEDLASQKSLDLLRRIELGEWDMSGRAPSEIAGFLSKVARNGLLDLLRERGRRARPREGHDDDPDAFATQRNDRLGPIATVNAPDSRVESLEFVAALRQCVERLQPRSQRIWFLRVLCGMPSRDIARHPEIGVKTAHVDVLLQRCRQAIRDCMRGRGHEPREMPPGTFVELWKTIRVGTNRAWGDER